jgi:hypothetical protein
MFSFILWIIGGIIVLTILYYIGVIIFTIFGLKQIFGWAKQELHHVPSEYKKMQKEVKNENSVSEPVERFVKGTIVRWFDRLR